MFDEQTFAFLSALSAGKDKPWFDANRAVYEDHLMNPLRRLVGVVGARLLQLDGSFEVRPQVNKTLTRLNKDMRFTKGSPYKDHMLALFYRTDRKKLDPQLFVGLQPEESWVGLYVGPHLLSEAAPIRSVIRDAPERLHAAARQAGIGGTQGTIVATCERYGQVKSVLSGKDAADFAGGPHLCVMRRMAAPKVISAGDGFAEDCAGRIAALFPLWCLYAG